uniref:Uncharacterized protein n=1 Tax=Oryza sativa subsp. japonica TaxID=39947 RepID=Q338J9_ORYSJ|nr:hypothetical protein LOC_Os10g25940 [Oryza sativa Japonica Group]
MKVNFCICDQLRSVYNLKRGKCDEEKAKNGIKDNFVRFSFGIEKFEDLRDDILQALGKI